LFKFHALRPSDLTGSILAHWVEAQSPLTGPSLPRAWVTQAWRPGISVIVHERAQGVSTASPSQTELSVLSPVRHKNVTFFSYIARVKCLRWALPTRFEAFGCGHFWRLTDKLAVRRMICLPSRQIFPE